MQITMMQYLSIGSQLPSEYARTLDPILGKPIARHKDGRMLGFG
jgi:hypothetical protein